MAKYKKLADGRYRKRVLIGHTEAGNKKFKCIYGRTIQELEHAVVEFKALQNRGAVISDERLTVGRWARTWVDVYKADVKPATRKDYEQCLRAHFGSINDVRLKDMSVEHVRAVVNSLGETPRAQQKFLLTINQVLKQAVESGKLYRNVAASIKLTRRPKPKKRALSDAEIKDIMSLELPAMTRAFLAVILYCGLRRGEAWALTRNDIDLRARTLSVNKTVYFDGGVKVGSPKSQAAIRVLPIPGKLYDILAPYLRGLGSLCLFGQDGHLLGENQFRMMWLGFVGAYNASKGGSPAVLAIASDITPHIFRHTYATKLYAGGVDLKRAQYLLGHSTIAMTLDVYTHLKNAKPANAVREVDACF